MTTHSSSNPIEQIRRAHASARPNRDNPAWMNCHHDCGMLLIEIGRLQTVLERYMFAYPAFRMKPIGAPGSAARIESERLMALEEEAQKLLSGRNMTDSRTPETQSRQRYSRLCRKLKICGWYLSPPSDHGRLCCKLDAGHKGKHRGR